MCRGQQSSLRPTTQPGDCPFATPSRTPWFLRTWSPAGDGSGTASETEPMHNATSGLACVRDPRILTAVFYGLLPIVGIPVFGWDWRSVLLLYWFENVTAGLLNVVSMIRTKRVQPEGEAPMTFNDSTKPASRSGLVLFFIAHYGIFTLVHGIFVLLICAGVFNFLGGSIVGKGLFGDLSLVNWRGILLIWFGGTVMQLIALLLTRADRLPLPANCSGSPTRESSSCTSPCSAASGSSRSSAGHPRRRSCSHCCTSCSTWPRSSSNEEKSMQLFRRMSACRVQLIRLICE